VQCPHIPEIEYGAFSERLHAKVAAGRIPIAGSLELTLRCNLRCVHCYAGHAHGGIPGQRELTADEIGSILGQAADEGCLWLLLTGGEPLLRPDFQDIYTGAKRRGFLITLFTNGTLMTPELANLLAEWPPFAVEITLYGRTQETYERVTGVPGSHARCMRGIELTLERGLSLKLKAMALTANVHELGNMRSYAESLGAEFDFDPVVNARLDGGAIPAKYRLPVDDILRLELADERRRSEWPTLFRDRSGVRADSRDLYLCSAGMNAFHVDPYGRLSLCLMVREPYFDLRKSSFSEGWRDFLLAVRSEQHDEQYECAQCDLRFLCGQCPGWGYLEHGSAQARVEFLCALTRARATAFLDGDATEVGGLTDASLRALSEEDRAAMRGHT